MIKLDTTVLIVGAGPTGLTLACELARAKCAFRIIEASPEPQKGSRAKGIQPRSLELFDNLGIVDRVFGNGRISMPMVSTGADGEVTRRGGEAPVFRSDIPYSATLITPQWRIEETLRDRLAALGGTVEFGVQLTGLVALPDSISAIVVTDERQTMLSALWLVGCDGGHSIVRKQAGIQFAGETLEDVRMIVADVAADGVDRESWHMWSHSEGMAALCPLPSTDEFQLQVSISPGQDPDLSLDNMQSILNARAGREDICLHGLGWSSLWRANVRMVDRYRAERVLLAGDAAHIHSPAGGQGMNTGMQDAHNLGWKLAAVLQGATIALLDTYQEERLPVAAAVLDLSNELLRKAIATQSFSAVRDGRGSQLGIEYRNSSLSQDDRTDSVGLRAGDRAPDATGLITQEGPRRLFDLLRGGHFTLLAFGLEPDLTEIRRRHHWLDMQTFRIEHDLSGSNSVVDGNGSLKVAYQPQECTLVLIRPDGYVGMIADRNGATALIVYLSRTFT